MNALAVFLSVAFLTGVWGPIGAFLSSPVLIVGLILKDHLLAPTAMERCEGVDRAYERLANDVATVYTLQTG